MARLFSIIVSGLVALLVGILPMTTALALQVTGLKNPSGFIVDPATGRYYISNANGGPLERDNNGFITKLNEDGKIATLKFIEGGRAGVTLHAPKGMAILDNTLFVSDITTVRRFDLATGRPLGEIDLSAIAVDFLTGLAIDGAGLLYIADTGADMIVAVAVRGKAKPAILAQDSSLAGPHGLTVNPATGALVAVSWSEGKILEIAKDGSIKVLFANSFFNARFGNLSGVDYDAFGNLYVADFSQGKVLRIDPEFRIQTIAEFLTTPASVTIDRKNHLILVPYLTGHAAEMNGLGRDPKRK